MNMEGAMGAFRNPELAGGQIPSDVLGAGASEAFKAWDEAEAAELAAATQWQEADPTREADTAAEVILESPTAEAVWAMRHQRRLRTAGSRATWHDRRGIPDQHGHDEREIDFRGRYQGPAKILPKIIAAAEGDDIASILP